MNSAHIIIDNFKSKVRPAMPSSWIDADVSSIDRIKVNPYLCITIGITVELSTSLHPLPGVPIQRVGYLDLCCPLGITTPPPDNDSREKLGLL